MSKIAVIDLGTNTFQLNIYQKKNDNIEIIYSEKSGVSLGDKGIINNKIHHIAFKRGIDALIHFKVICNKFDVNTIIAVGTSALRDADNKIEFCDKSLEETGINIKIIDGNIEANLIFKGVMSSFNNNEDCLIMDIGGGSTEIIYVVDTKPSFYSFNIGISRMFQLKELEDPLSENDIAFLIQFMDKEANILNSLPKIKNFIGAAGSYETIYQLINFEKFNLFNSCYLFDYKKFENTIESIIKSTLKERIENSNILPIRKQLLGISALQMKWMINKCSAENIFISSNSLPEGVIFNYFENNL